MQLAAASHAGCDEYMVTQRPTHPLAVSRSHQSFVAHSVAVFSEHFLRHEFSEAEYTQSWSARHWLIEVYCEHRTLQAPVLPHEHSGSASHVVWLA